MTGARENIRKCVGILRRGSFLLDRRINIIKSRAKLTAFAGKNISSFMSISDSAKNLQFSIQL